MLLSEKNSPQNQEVKSSEARRLFDVLGLFGATAMILASPLSLRNHDDTSQKTRRSAEVVGLQLIQLYQESLVREASDASSSQMRKIASIEDSTTELRPMGTIGSDPFGKPFNYRILNQSGQKLQVLVWSSGPNSKIETPELLQEKSPSEIAFKGDDDGLVLSNAISTNLPLDK